MVDSKTQSSELEPHLNKQPGRTKLSHRSWRTLQPCKPCLGLFGGLRKPSAPARSFGTSASLGCASEKAGAGLRVFFFFCIGALVKAGLKGNQVFGLNLLGPESETTRVARVWPPSLP